MRSRASWFSSTQRVRLLPGMRSAPDTPWQKELEDAFAFTETIDQLTVISEVKADMEKPVPDGPGGHR